MPRREACGPRRTAAALTASIAACAFAAAGEPADGAPSIEEMLLAVGGAPAGETSPGREGAPAPAPAAADALSAALAEFDALLEKGDLAGAKARAREASRDPAFAESRPVLAAAEVLAASLLARHSLMRQAMEAHAGQDVTVWTATGRRRGELAELSDAGFTLAVKTIINREVRGVTLVSVAWGDLTPKEQDRLAKGWEADDLALAALAFMRGDEEAGENALVLAGNNPLAPHYRAKIERKRAAAADRSAGSAWEAIERKAKPPVAAAAASALLEEIAQFEKAHGATGFAASARERIEAVRSAVRGTLGPTAGLVAHWAFDDGRGAVARDSAGANHATVSGATWVRGRSGGALSFDGADDFAELPAAATAGLKTFSFSFWVSTKEDRAAATYWHRPCLLGQATKGVPSGDIGVNTNAGFIGLWHGLGPGDRQYLSRHTRIGDGEWHHVAVAAGTSGVRLYVDGRHEAFLPTTNVPLGKTAFRVGTENGEDGGFPSSGVIDDIRLYSRALTGVEVLALAGVDPAAAEPDLRPDVPVVVGFPAAKAKFARLLIHASSQGQPGLDEIEVYGPDGGRNLALASAGATATASSCIAGYERHRIPHLNDGLCGNASSWVAAGVREEWAQIELAKPAVVTSLVFSRDRMGGFRDRLPVHFEVQLSLDGKRWQTAREVKPRPPRGG